MGEECPRARMQRATVRGEQQQWWNSSIPLGITCSNSSVVFFSPPFQILPLRTESLYTRNTSQLHRPRQQRPAFSCPLTFIFGTDSFPKAPINPAHTLRNGKMKKSWTGMKHPPNPPIWRQPECKPSLTRHLSIRVYPFLLWSSFPSPTHSSSQL